MSGVTVEGLNELLVKLDKPVDLRRPMLKVGNDIENAAKQNCNGAFDNPTGALKRSIRSDLIRSGPTVTGVEVGTNLEYAVYVEYGTGLYAFGGQGRPSTPEHPIPWRYRGSDGQWHTTSGQRPKPFLIPAFNSKKRNILKYIEEEYDDSL